jgi:hypothetical protein
MAEFTTTGVKESFEPHVLQHATATQKPDTKNSGRETRDLNGTIVAQFLRRKLSHKPPIEAAKIKELRSVILGTYESFLSFGTHAIQPFTDSLAA